MTSAINNIICQTPFHFNSSELDYSLHVTPRSELSQTKPKRRFVPSIASLAITLGSSLFSYLLTEQALQVFHLP